MKKVLTFILVLSMILGSIGRVFAAPALDDIAGTVYEKAVNRLALLEILEGYPDGTFKPDNTITRAEFAAVAVRAKGLKDAAIASEGLATGFTDVPASHWASGYINIATKLGLVNGMGDGTYAPEAPITYEQAVTLIVRTLGYEPSAQTKGGYPYGYLIVANEIELLDGVKGVQGAPAPRGIVAQITDNALEIAKMIQVGFGTDAKFVVSGSREHGDDTYPQYLLHDLGVDEVIGDLYETFRLEKSTLKKNEVKISDLRGDNKYNKYKITDDVDADALLGTGVTAWAKDDVIFAARVGYREKIGKIVYSFSEEQVKYDELTKSNKDEVTLTVLDDEYDWAARPVVYVNNKSVDAKDVGDGAWGRIVLDEDDDIKFAYLFKFDAGNSGIVTGIDKDDIEYVNLDAAEDVLALDKAKNVYVFNEDLSKAELDDIEEGTAIFYWKDKDDFYIVLTDEIVEGNLDAVRVSDSRVTVDGTNVSKADDAIFSDNEMKDFDVWEDYVEAKEYVDEDVTIHKNLVGKAIALVTDAKARSSTIYGIATWKTGDRKPVLSVYTAEGKEIDYKFADSDDAAKIDAGDVNGSFQAVAFKLNKDGEIAKKEFEVINKEIKFAKNDKDKFATDGGERYYLTKDTVILKALNSNGKVKPSVIKYDDIIKKTVDKNNKAIIKTVKGNDLAIVVFIESGFDAVEDDAKYGLVTDSPRKVGKNYKVEIDIAGEGKGDYVLAEADIDDVVKGALIAFKFNHKDEVVLEDSATLSVGKTGSKVTEKEGKYLTIGNVDYRVTDDTVYYATDKKGKLDGTTRLAKIKAGSWVVFLADDNELQVVVDVTAYVEEVGVEPGDGDAEGGVVTYINVEEGLIEVDDKVLELHSRVRLIDADGKTLAIGPKEVAKELKEGDILDKITEKDGIVTEMKLAKEKEPDEPDEPEEITVTYEAKYNAVVGKYAVAITLSDETMNDKVTEIIVDGTAYEPGAVVNGMVTVKGSFDVEPTTVEVVVDGKTIPATK